MNPVELLAQLTAQDVHVSARDGRLVIKARKDAVSAELKSLLQEHKASLLDHLEREAKRAAPPELKPIARGEPLPLSFAQQRLWYLDQLQGASTVYTMAFALRFKGKFDSEAMARALQLLFERHEALRARFVMQDEEPRAIIDAAQALPIEHCDLDQASSNDSELERCVQEFGERPFDLAQGPLARALIVRVGEQDHALVFAVHHSVCDGGSVEILQDDLAAAYSAFVDENSPELAELPIQYADYAAWQKQCFDGGSLESQLEFWRQQLGGELPSLDMPSNKTRPRMMTYNGAMLHVDVPNANIEAIVEAHRAKGVTPFMVLIALVASTIARYSNSSDILLGTPIANRSKPELANVVGLFVNTLVLRLTVSDGMPFSELLDHVRNTMLDVFDNQDTPFERLVEELHPPQELSRSPIFQSMVSYHQPALQQRRYGDLETTPIELSANAARFDLTFFLSQQRDCVRLGLEYNTDLFTESEMAQFSRHFQTCCERFASDPSQRLAQLELLDASERQSIDEWNRTDAPYPHDALLHSLISKSCSEHSDKTAIIFNDTSITYAELDQRANQLASYLIHASVAPGDVVAIYLERSLWTVVSLLAVLKTGATYLPLDPFYPADRIAYMLSDSGSKLTLSTAALADGLSSVLTSEDGDSTPCPILKLDELTSELEQAGSKVIDASGDPQSLAYLLYTSGSTGKPKGVMVQHQAVVNFLASMANEPGMTRDDVLLAVTTTSFDISVLELYLPLLVGGTVVIADRAMSTDSQALANAMSEHQISIMQATPATWRLLIDGGWPGRANLRVLCGGEPFPHDLALGLLERCQEVWNMYGPTETTVWSTCQRLLPGEPVTIGRPIANTQVHILNIAGQTQPPGVAGELCIGGDGVTKGYLHREELTADRFVADPFSNNPNARLYKTGDLAKRGADGRLWHLGRMDTQVKVRGYRIELGEIEARLNLIDGIAQSAVIVHEPAPGDQRLVAFLTSLDGVQVQVSALRKALRVDLPDYMVPQQFVVLDVMPLTPNGKIDRRALQPKDTGGRSAEEAEAPRTETEQIIAQIWRDLIGGEAIGRESNFFSAGGHSLLAVKAAARMEKQLGCEVTASMLVLETLAQIAESAEQQQLDARSTWWRRAKRFLRDKIA
ncbi:MAG: amino acid adenylation domain-containing protein [Pseudomonadaceae bacterium]|nr:amino acid adenylation domain-containing protein [Pseudomonadaceae bacterium]